MAAQLIDFLSRENSRVKSFFHIDYKMKVKFLYLTILTDRDETAIYIYKYLRLMDAFTLYTFKM